MFIKLLFGFSPEVLTLMLVNVLYIISIIIIVEKMWRMDSIVKVKKSIDHYFLIPPLLIFVGGFIDVFIYSESIGGIQGATPYTFMVMFNAMISVPVTLFILIMCRKKILKEKKFNSEN